jgi:hypothetical protein
MDRDSLNSPKYLSNYIIGKQLIGFFIYVIIFVIMIPYILLKNSKFELLKGYIPNLDMVATILGFQSKTTPEIMNCFKYLYNPDTSTIYGLISQSTINYIALLGATFIISYYTLKSKSIAKGWGLAFIMMPVTYLLPGNFIAYYMQQLYDYLDKKYTNQHIYIRNGLVYGLGVLIALIFINIESYLIEHLGEDIAQFLHKNLNI